MSLADIDVYKIRFAAMLDREFQAFGLPHGLPAGLRDAVEATPRHRFVHRFRLGDGPLIDFDAEPLEHLGTVYSDRVMRHVDAEGAPLASSNSQPSFVLWLLHLLDLRPGQRVLEIGSGSGWLAAIMAHLVGPDGAVTGIEIIPALALRSRADLAALGRGNVTIVNKDGTAGHSAGAPFDRVMITAATWDLPAALFEQVAEGGCVLVPIALRGSGSCQVSLLRRTGEHFVDEHSIIGWFVPLIGAGQQRTDVTGTLESLPFRAGDAACVRVRLPLGASADGRAGPVGDEFRAFLGRTERGFAVFDTLSGSFGLIDDATKSVALWAGGEIIGYGGQAAAGRLVDAFARWAELGLPGMGAFRLEVWRAGGAPEGTDRCWVERRDETALVWRLDPDATRGGHCGTGCRPVIRSRGR